MAQNIPDSELVPQVDSSAKDFRLGQFGVGDHENTVKKPQFSDADDLQLYECWVFLSDFKFPEILEFVVPPQVFV